MIQTLTANKMTRCIAMSIFPISLVMVTLTPATAETTGYNQLSFQTKVKQEVVNNEIQASLYIKSQSKNPKELATELNTAMNKASTIAKKYPTIQVITGHQTTYPRYDKKDKIIGWTGQSSINIKSTDIPAASELIAELQSFLLMAHLDFAVSEARKKDIEKALILKASKAFQSQADTMVDAWGAKDYKLIKMSLNSVNNVDYSMPLHGFAAAMESNSVPEQNLSSGKTTLSMTANGVIELVK